MTAPTAAPKFHSIAVTPPPVGVPVVIWWHVRERVAVWGGRGWRDEHGAPLAGPILYWREAPESRQ